MVRGHPRQVLSVHVATCFCACTAWRLDRNVFSVRSVCSIGSCVCGSVSSSVLPAQKGCMNQPSRIGGGWLTEWGARWYAPLPEFPCRLPVWAYYLSRHGAPEALCLPVVAAAIGEFLLDGETRYGLRQELKRRRAAESGECRRSSQRRQLFDGARDPTSLTPRNQIGVDPRRLTPRDVLPEECAHVRRALGPTVARHS